MQCIQYWVCLEIFGIGYWVGIINFYSKEQKRFIYQAMRNK